MAEAKISAVIKRRALEQATFAELKEAYVAKVLANPFLPEIAKDTAADVVDQHLNGMSRELERLELVVRRMTETKVEGVTPEIVLNGVPKKKRAPRKKAKPAEA